MPLMCLALPAMNLGTLHTQGVVSSLFNTVAYRRPETGPTTTGVIFAVRIKQVLATDNTQVFALLLVVVVLAGEWRLCTVSLCVTRY